MKRLILATVGVALLLGSCSKPEKTIAHLKAAALATHTTSLHYAACARVASQDGFTNTASMFRALSVADSCRWAGFIRELDEQGVKDFTPASSLFEVQGTLQNLQTMWESEDKECRVVYPAFAADASSEKAHRAEQLFTWAAQSARKHAEFCIAVKEVLSDSLKGDAFVTDVWAVCPGCGDIYMITGAPEICPQCDTDAKLYRLFGDE